MNLFGGMTARGQWRAQIASNYAELKRRIDENNEVFARMLDREADKLKADMLASIGRWSPDA